MNTKGRLLQMSDGTLIEEDVLNVIQKLQDYDPNLRVKFLNPDQMQEVGDAPYALFELCSDGMERLIFTFWELDERIVQRVYAADNARTNVLSNIDRNNAAIRAASQRRYKERNLEVADIMKHMLSNPKGTYSFEIDGKHIKVDDDPKSRPVVTKTGDA